MVNGIEQAERVGEAKAPRTGALHRFHHLREKVDIGARRILAADADLVAGIQCAPDVAVDLRQHPGAVAAELVLDMHIGNRDRQIDDVDRTARRRGKIAVAHPAPGNQAHRQFERGDRLYHLDLVPAHRRNADFHLGHAGIGKGLRDRALLLGGERHAGSLLAIAQRRVVDGYRIGCRDVHSEIHRDEVCWCLISKPCASEFQDEIQRIYKALRL